MAQKEAVRPCPLCGSRATVSYGDENIGWNDVFFVVRVKCSDHKNCGVQLEMADRPDSEAANMRLVNKAIATWNRRVGDRYGQEG